MHHLLVTELKLLAKIRYIVRKKKKISRSYDIKAKKIKRDMLLKKVTMARTKKTTTRQIKTKTKLNTSINNRN